MKNNLHFGIHNLRNATVSNSSQIKISFCIPQYFEVRSFSIYPLYYLKLLYFLPSKFLLPLIFRINTKRMHKSKDCSLFSCF